jgi:endonuclease YncB( thermonuclease family)
VAQELRGTVTRVVDGDTLYIDGVEPSIRLWGIDAPETGTDYGAVATLFLKALAEGKDARCLQRDRDRHGRIVAVCEVESIEIGGALVRFGFARDYARYSGGSYAAEEDEARRERRGMWRP